MTRSNMLAGQVALVTGANSGIGAAVVRALAAKGAAVVINYLDDRESALALAHDVESSSGQAMVIQADVSRESDVTSMIERVRKHFGTLDIMVANAGIQRDAPFIDMTLEQWNAVIGVNLTGAFLCAREAARAFLEREADSSRSSALGKIIFISSVHQRIPWARHVNYASAKGGMMQLMSSCAQELAHLKIRVNAIAPGAIKTPINRSAWTTEQARRRLLELIPYGRIGEPEDIGKAAAWLASDEADYVHGTTLFVDGGMTLFPGFETGSG